MKFVNKKFTDMLFVGYGPLYTYIDDYELTCYSRHAKELSDIIRVFRHIDVKNIDQELKRFNNEINL
jgi:hypothetical protein